MVDGAGLTLFAVVFYDGEREMNIGNVQINPALEYKPFQLMLSQMIGISPNQISIYLVDRKKNQALPFTEDRRRIPITGKVNFGLICRQKNCYFLVVLKRSRKSRNRRERIGDIVEYSDCITENQFSPPPEHLVPDKLILLRRDQPVQFYDQITQPELSVLNSRLQNLRLQRERYLLAMARGDPNPPNIGSGPDPIRISNPKYFGVPSSMAKSDGAKTLCSECVEEKNAGTPSFHACVRDAVVTRFASRFGPANRPVKPLPWKLYELFPSNRKNSFSKNRQRGLRTRLFRELAGIRCGRAHSNKIQTMYNCFFFLHYSV
ncbi:hypothetical protein F511_38639 [Dorcoceras hygrometricum]|uniref:DUF7138 domain-containing protein n=1 Tax=Dorcoceras hygrometricum TaxID=472368 RepID=A0A2Z7A2K5_9LAMI|nr:hypothetical protein F511_38639 [Dorcoceras hygrometricum]